MQIEVNLIPKRKKGREYILKLEIKKEL